MGVPPNHPRIFRYKPSILGIATFMEPPYNWPNQAWFELTFNAWEAQGKTADQAKFMFSQVHGGLGVSTENELWITKDVSTSPEHNSSLNEYLLLSICLVKFHLTSLFSSRILSNLS